MAGVGLYPYQEAGRDELMFSRAKYLGDDPGLGKTAQIVTAAEGGGARRVLVLCPASLKANWLREFQKFSDIDAPTLTPTKRDKIPKGPLICAVNYDIVVDKMFHGELARNQWDVLACDEAHALKNPASKRTRAVLGDIGLANHADQTWLASGTPAPNHAGELYPALARLHPTACRGMEYEEWLRHYFVTYDDGYSLKVVQNKPEIAQLREDLRGFLLRRRREEVLKDLPPFHTGVLTVQNDAALASIEAELAALPEFELLLAMTGGDTDERVLDALDDTASATLRRLCGEAKAPVIADIVAGELDRGTEKIVLMCWHHSVMDILQDKLGAYGVARVDGKTRDPQGEVDRFQDIRNTTNCRVFIGQIRSAAEGHTLTAACDEILVEPDWVPRNNTQAMFRIHRIGQTKSCTVRFAALAGSFDEVLMRTIERKSRNLAELEL